MADERLSRAAARAYRVATHQLQAGAAGAGEVGVLDTGIQDTPPGTVAHLALAARLARPPATGDGLALVHAARGTMHVHRAADLADLAAALRPDETADLRPQTYGNYFAEHGVDAVAGLDAVAAAMAEVMADGVRRTKGELSTALRSRVDKRFRPWCGSCGADHVHDGLFRLASLPAGLRLVANGDGSADFVAGPPLGPARPTARRDLVRRFVRYAGPTDRDGLAAWLGLSPAAARRWWSLVADELVRVDVEGRRLFLHQDDLALARDAPAPRGVRLLPPYDPVLELCDRALLVPDPARRKQVWRPVANPGAVLDRGEVVAVWRRRGDTVTVTPFATLPATTRRAIERDAGGTVVLAGA